MNNRSVNRLVLDLSEVVAGHVELVGAKCSSLGELLCCLAPRGVRAVDGFATTSDAYRLLLQSNTLEKSLRELIAGLDYKDIDALNGAGHRARTLILETELPRTLRNEIIDAYLLLCDGVGHVLEVAVRSSATAEDLPDASFAGQQETRSEERRVGKECR